MDTNQNFGSLLNDFSGSSPSGGQAGSDGDAFGAVLNGHQRASEAALPSRPKPGTSAGSGRRSKGALDPALVDSITSAEGLSPKQRQVMNALLDQESGFGRNAVTSTDGAQGAGQIMPGTFRLYAKPGEDINNTSHNLAVMGRIIKDLGGQFGDDPGKIATGYFSGSGNVNRGQGSAWKNDRKDGNGKSVSGYVNDVLARVAGAGEVQAAAPGRTLDKAAPVLPDLSQTPKWRDIAAGKKYQQLPAADKQKLQAAYFDDVIAPHATASGADVAAVRQKFMTAEPGVMDKIAKAAGALFNDEGSVLEAPGVSPATELPTTSKVPVERKVRQAFDAAYDSATPEQRQAMAQQNGWRGQLARERAGLFERQDQNMEGMPVKAALDKIDPRMEVRRGELIGKGEDPRFADRAAQEAAGAGVMPGQEVAYIQNQYGTANKSAFDADTQKLFDTKSGAFNTVGERGIAKGALGLSKAATGYMQFMADVYGMDEAGKTVKGWSTAIQEQENAIGDQKDFLARNMEGAVSSIAQQIPLLMSGATLGQAGVLAGMGLQSFGQEYADGKAAGQTSAQAAARAGTFAAFEVIGEKFGLKETLQAIKGAARGMPSDQIAGFLWAALKKEVPGEFLTTTGQFATDKWAPGGVALNPNATGEDYLKQMADTFTQTIMQAGMMTGGTTGVSTAVRYARERGPGEGVANADAELAKAQALNKWDQFSQAGQQSAAITPDGRIEPTMDGPAPAADVHPTVSAADDIVRELATAAGVPLETVLPQNTAPAQAQTAPPATDSVAPTTDEAGQQDFTDQDVIDFAEGRFQQLRAKSEGTLETQMTDQGPVDSEVPGTGLTAQEQHELTALQQAHGQPAALRQLYGFDETAAGAAPLEQAAVVKDSLPVQELPVAPVQEPAAPLPQGQFASAEEATAYISQQRRAGAGSLPPALPRPFEDGTFGVALQGGAGWDEARTLAQASQPKTEKESRAQRAQPQEPSHGTQATEAIQTETQGPAAPTAAEQVAATPRTEKEANQQRDHSAKWFGTQDKADAYLAKNSIAGTHTVVQAGKKFEILAKAPVGAAVLQAQSEVPKTKLWPSADNFAMTEKYKTEDTRSSIEQFESGRESIKSMDDVREALAQQPSLPPSLSSRLQEVHKASGRDVKRSVVLRSLNMEKADQTGTPKAKRERAEIIARLEADLALFDTLPAPARPASANHDLNAMFDDVLAEELAKDAAKAPPKTEKQAKTQRVTKPNQAAGAQEAARADYFAPGNIVNSYSGFDRVVQYRPSSGGAAWSVQVQAVQPAPGGTFRDIANEQPRWHATPPDERTRKSGPLLRAKGEPATVAKPSTEKQAQAQRSATQAAVSAAKNTAAGLNDAIDGLGKLFGGNGRLSSGLSFDEDTYAKAKPLFVQAISHLGEAGSDMKEAMRTVIRMVLDKFGAQAANAMKPFVVRFIEENSTQVSDVAKPEAPAQNAVTQPETPDANPVQTEPVPRTHAGQDQAAVAAGDRDRQPLGTGLAEDGEGAGAGGSVSGRTDAAGTEGAGRADPAGDQSPGAPRDRAGVRPEPVAAGSDADHVIDAEDIGKGGLAKKYKDNVAAIRIIKAMEAEGRVATPDERKQIAKYVGWGAIKGVFDPANKQWGKQHAEIKDLLTDAEFRAARKSTLDAHYTSPIAVTAMYDALARMGFSGGRVLEPSVGVGNFFGLMPAGMRKASNLHGVELDALTSRLVAALYPTAKIAQSKGFEDFQIPAEYFDVVVGNPPFGSHPLVDAERSAYSGFSIHNYFLAKGVDKLRPGGLMQVVVSHNFLDAQDGKARKWIADRASLVGAVRLPNTAFKENAGTEVVTDILIFQKHDLNGLPKDMAPWVNVVDQINTNPKTGESVTHKVNQFFAANPGSVLGTPSAAGSMYAANEYTVQATGDMKERLAGWVKTLPENIYRGINRKSDNAVVDMAIPDGIKNGSYYLDAAGKVMQRGADVMGDKTANAWMPPSETAVQRMKGMIGLRDSLRQQMRLERSLDATAAEIEANRTDMNALYDAFLKKHGHVNSQVNRKIFLDDTESQLLQALEFDFDKGLSKAVAEREGLDPKDASAVKADIFKRRVAFPPQDFLTVTTAKDALLQSLNYRGKVDGAYMAEVYGKPQAEIIKELGDVVFDDPQHGIVTADEYLAGDVKTKLAEAKAAAQSDGKYQRNVAALENVIPADKKPSEISVSIGAAFVPAALYEKFVKHISGGAASVTYLKSTGQWLMDFKGGADQTLNTGKFGTSHLSAQELFGLAMLGRGAVVKKTTRNADGSNSTVVLEKETEAAREKQNSIKDEWKNWIWADMERADQLVGIYNDTMNRIVERKFDGEHLTFPGMNPGISLLAHQKNGVWRGLQSYQVLYDHVVGAGKTFEMATLAMEMRRLGIARKPLFIVPNHLTLQWRSEFTRLYPGSNILAATPEDFSKDNRERMFSKIITGDWDAVVIGHSSLKKIGLPEETERAVLQEQIDEVAEAIEEMKRARGDRNIIGDMEKIRRNLEAKMKDKLAAIGKRSKVVTFDELGIDAMFTDEMHEFKNLSYNSTMDRNPGMGNPAGSAKAFDMFVKTRWMFDTFGAKTPYITATGTPVSNSLVEMYNMQRYMQYPTLKKAGLHVFDAWAKQFGSVENVYEVAPSGSGFRRSTRFSKFTNLPGLMGLYNSFADTVTLDDLKAQEESQGNKFPVPRLVSGKPVLVVAKRSPEVAERMGVPRAEVNEAGAVVFGLDLAGGVSIAQDAKSGKFNAKVGDTNVGQFETEQDARLKIVEMALSPKVTVDPQSILGRFANLRHLTKESKGKINALSLTGEANKMALDYRLIDPSAKDFPGSKINLAVENMMKVYRQWSADKGTQLVFCDMSIPLSARASYTSKARRLYVRDDAGALEMKRGTMHTLEGQESLPYFIMQRGDKEAKRFDVYDAASGVLMIKDSRSKDEARNRGDEALAAVGKRQKWIDAREAAGELSQDQIDEYNNENEVETEGFESFSMEDIAGMSGSAKFSVYDDIKAKLIGRGVPEREIAFIHDYSTPVAKDKLFKAVNSGEVRFLLGSTPKMGAGTNVQTLAVGLHHIDAPWRPSDLEQREGRIIRRGNALYARDPAGFEVFIGRYATEQTYDTRRWQLLEHKARGIEQLRNFDGTINEIDDIDGESANSADMKAAASGDPLILEETKLRGEVRRLEQLQAGHADEAVGMGRKAQSVQAEADTHGPRRVAEIKALLDAVKKHPLDKDGFAPVTADGKVLTDKEKALAEITRASSVVRAGMAQEATLMYRGVTFELSRNGWGAGWLFADSPTGNIGQWGVGESFSTSGFLQRMANYVGRLQDAFDETQAGIAKAAQSAVDLRAQAKQPFAQGPALDDARAAYVKVQRALMAKGPAVPEEQKRAVAQGMADQKERLEALGYGEALKELLGTKDIQFMADDGYTENDGIEQRPTESSTRNIRELNLRVAEFLRRKGVSVDDNVQPYVGGSVRGGEALRLVERAFGARTQWFALRPGLTDLEKRTWGNFNGAHLGGVNFLRSTGNDRPHLSILGHEIVHQLKRDNPDLYADFEDAVRPFIKLPEYRKDFLPSNVAKDAGTPAKQTEEFMAEVGSDAFMEPKFWQAIGQNNPDLLAKMVDMVTKLVDTIRAKLGYTKRTERYLSDYEKVVTIAADVLGRYMGSKVEATGQDGGIQFNAQDELAPHTSIARRVQNNLVQFFGNRDKSLKTFGLYDKTLSTQYNKALKDKHYGKVFGLVNAMQNEVSLTSIRPAELAPGVLPRVDDVKSAVRTLVKGKKADSSLAKAAHAIFSGTLDGGSVLAGRTWTEEELRGKFGLDDAGVALYQQSRAAIDASLDEVAAAEAYAMAQGFIPKTMRRAVIDDPRQAEALIAGELHKQIQMLDAAIRAAKKQGSDQQAEDLKDSKVTYQTTLRNVEKIFITGKNLKEAGYAPLMRFGKFTVTVQQIDEHTGNVAKDADGESMTEFYGQYETQGEARAVENEMRAKYEGQDGMRVTAGTKSQTSHELYAGISPETLALFAEAVGATEATRKFYQLALTERSALKRRLERKGTSGFNQDLPRVLSNFITSNARFAAQRYYLRDLNNAIKFIPKEKGDVLDEAMALKKFVMDPKDTGAVASSMMFAWFLGGSVASAVVNLTQPVMMTGPYLSQFGLGVATKSMVKALPYALGKKQITDATLREAIKRASQEGIVDAQEIFHLYSVGAQGVATGLVNTLARIPGIGGKVKAGSESGRARITSFGTLWGSMFSLAEGFNRKLTFIAAWEVALANAEKNPYAFAVRAVNETQGIYSKVNRPNWARTTVGRTVLTFKQFSLMYMEMLNRMWSRGGPEGKRAALIMMAVLMLASGEEGLPFAQDLDDLLDTVGQMFGLDTNMRRNKRRLAHQILGKSLGDLFLYGVSSTLPLDFAGRLGLGNLVPGTGMLKPSSESGRVREVSEVFGPAAGLATQIADAYDAATEGNLGKAAQNMAPTAVRNAAAGLEMAKKGYGTDTKGRKVTETTGLDAAFKGIGFNPTAVAQEHRKTMPVQQDVALQKKTEASIVEQWSQGAADNDQAMMAKAQKRMVDWNKSNPDTLIQINAQQIRGRVRQMLTDKDARLMKSVPREMRGRMGLDLAK